MGKVSLPEIEKSIATVVTRGYPVFLPKQPPSDGEQPTHQPDVCRTVDQGQKSDSCLAFAAASLSSTFAAAATRILQAITVLSIAALIWGLGQTAYCIWELRIAAMGFFESILEQCLWWLKWLPIWSLPTRLATQASVSGESLSIFGEKALEQLETLSTPGVVTSTGLVFKCLMGMLLASASLRSSIVSAALGSCILWTS